MLSFPRLKACKEHTTRTRRAQMTLKVVQLETTLNMRFEILKNSYLE